MLARGEVYYAALGGLLAAVRVGRRAVRARPRGAVLRPPRRAPRAGGRVPGVDARPLAAGGRRRRRGLRLRGVRHGRRRRRRGRGAPQGDPRAAPGLAGVLFDRPGGRGRRESPLPAGRGATSSSRCPPGADAYLLSRVIHDWADADAVAILRTCRAGDGRPARLLLVEADAARAGGRPPGRDPDGPAHARAARRPGAHPRGVPALLADASFELRRAVPTGSPAGLSVLEATVASSER